MTKVTSNPLNTPKAWIDGQYREASKGTDGKWYVTDNQGRKVEVDPNDLFGMNSNLTEWPEHFVDYYGDMIEKKESQKESLMETENSLAKKIKAVKDSYNGILAKYGASSWKDINDGSQKALAKKFYNDLSGLKSDKVSVGNQYFSACMTSFDYALEQGKWQNELNLAQHVQNSIFG